MIRRLILLPCLFSLVLSFSAFGGEQETKQIKTELVRAFPELAEATVRPAQIPGLYEIQLDTTIFYTTNDAKYLITGDLIDLDTRANLTEIQRAEIRTRLIDKIGEDSMIVIGPEKPKRTLTVFTDVDCPYCARFHHDVPVLNKYGVKVRYLFYPRAGLNSESYRRSVAVWCADNRIKAIGIAKSGGRLDMKTCPNPVERDYQLGERLDINGTPTIVLDNGKILPGYVPARQLLGVLGIEADPPVSAVQ